MKDKFIEFLKKHEVYEEWCKYTEVTHDASCSTFFETVDPEFYTNAAFLWLDVSGVPNIKDHDFWSNLNRLWLKEIES